MEKELAAQKERNDVQKKELNQGEARNETLRAALAKLENRAEERENVARDALSEAARERRLNAYELRAHQILRQLLAIEPRRRDDFAFGRVVGTRIRVQPVDGSPVVVHEVLGPQHDRFAFVPAVLDLELTERRPPAAVLECDERDFAAVELQRARMRQRVDFAPIASLHVM